MDSETQTTAKQSETQTTAKQSEPEEEKPKRWTPKFRELRENQEDEVDDKCPPEEEHELKRWTPRSQYAKPPNELEGPVLNPDNPLLEKFQKALKEHLERQINHLKDDIYEYECGSKKNNARREEMGKIVYEQQQVLENQQKTLDQYIARLETTSAAVQEVENVVTEKKEVFKKERELLSQAEVKELELRGEIEGTNLLIQQISQWEKNLESDITVKKRIYEKTRKDKQKLVEEKRMQDALIYKLMTRIWQLEQEQERMDLQMKVKEEEREELAQTVALGNTNIEAMESEYRCLIHSWNSVIIAIGNRDKVLTCLNKELVKNEEHFKSVVSEIEQVKKLSQKEMKKNEDLTMLRDRFVTDVKTCKAALDVELGKKTSLEKKMSEMQGIIEQTEIDIEKIADETRDTKNILAALQREHESLDVQKAELEEHIMKEMAEQVTNNKTAMTLQRALRHLKTKNREMEIQVATGENKVASVMSEIEEQKLNIFESQRQLTDLEEQLKVLGDEADRYQDETKCLDLRISKRQREVDMLNAKFQKMMEKSEMGYTSPLEMKITTLEKNIEEIQEQIKKLQQFWLREQSNLLRISEERQEQIQNNNLIRKQILILEQKKSESVRRFRSTKEAAG